MILNTLYYNLLIVQTFKNIMMKNKSLYTYLVLIVITVANINFTHKSFAQKKQDERPPTNVEVLPVYKEKIHDKVEVLGSTYANESVEITPNISETISEIKFTDGQKVEQGNVLVVLDKTEELAQLEGVKVQLQEHERELKRMRPLLKKNISTQRAYDERLTMRDITRQRIEEINAKIEDRTLKAPFAGRVGIRRLSNGALVEPGDIITTIEDVSYIKLDFNVPSIYLSQLLEPGTPIEAVSSVFPGMIFTGKVQTINNRVDPVTRSILVRAIIENTDEIIKPGIMMKVSLLDNERMGIIIPEESVVQRGNEHFVMVVKDDDTVDKRLVSVGINRDGFIEIKNNLELNEQVIVRGVHKVQQGAKVKISKTWESIRKPKPGDLKEY